MGLFDKKKNNTEKQEKQTEKTNRKNKSEIISAIGRLYRHKIFVKRNIQTEMDVSGK